MALLFLFTLHSLQYHWFKAGCQLKETYSSLFMKSHQAIGASCSPSVNLYGSTCSRYIKASCSFLWRDKDAVRDGVIVFRKSCRAVDTGFEFLDNNYLFEMGHCTRKNCWEHLCTVLKPKKVNVCKESASGLIAGSRKVYWVLFERTLLYLVSALLSWSNSMTFTIIKTRPTFNTSKHQTLNARNCWYGWSPFVDVKSQLLMLIKGHWGVDQRSKWPLC